MSGSCRRKTNYGFKSTAAKINSFSGAKFVEDEQDEEYASTLRGNVVTLRRMLSKQRGNKVKLRDRPKVFDLGNRTSEFKPWKLIMILSVIIGITLAAIYVFYQDYHLRRKLHYEVHYPHPHSEL